MRNLFPALVLASVAITLSACSGTGATVSPAGATANPTGGAAKAGQSDTGPAWEITVEGLGRPATLTGADLQKIGMVKVKAAVKQKDTTGPEQEWKGVPLAKALKHLGATQYTAVKVESRDGSASREYTPDLVDSEGTILGIEIDGKPLDGESGPVQLVVDGKGSNWWIKQVAKITVVK